MKVTEWRNHKGPILESENGFDVIDCEPCGFKHIVPIPGEKELEKVYRHEYYTQEKPLYLERYREDLEWWNLVYRERYEIFENFLDDDRRRVLDIGSGPGYFLLNGQQRGWSAKGVEPSEQAAEYSRSLGVDVEQAFYSAEVASRLGRFDVVNMSQVLEHVPEPAVLLSLVHSQLTEGGLICIVVPNDFNPFQLLLRNELKFDPWWVAPPHHINYFDFDSLSRLLGRCGFEVVHKEATFPIDMFLLMGDNYIGNDELGRKCHEKRKLFELNLANINGLGPQLRTSLAGIGIGREVVLVAMRSSGRFSDD